MRLKHDEVISQVIGYLIKDGYTLKQKATGFEKGVDIVAEKDGRELIIEAAGSISKSGRMKESAALGVDFFTNLGQLVCRMKEGKVDYALALDEAFKRWVHKKLLGYPKERIGIKVFMVTREGIKIL